MTIPSAQHTPETAFQREGRILREQLIRLLDCLFNQTFALTSKGSRRRKRVLFIFFALLGFAISLQIHSLGEWGQHLSYLFQYLFNPAYSRVAPDTPQNFGSFTLNTILDPFFLRYLPVFILPFIFALQAAASYLTDIFELNKVAIAREFILQVALSGGRKNIRIRGGKVIPEHLDSPLYLIGGPGRVIVDLDSAALFEKPNGQPHVIGPTVEGKEKLEGFERFRQAIDLRDHYTDPLEVNSRSLDGIPVCATDVRMIFSIWRNNKQPSAKSPYPFNKNAVEALVYGQACEVSTDGSDPSECDPSRENSMKSFIQGMIRDELGNFMSKHHLTKYLASIGLPEVLSARQRENEIVKIGKNVITKGDILETRKVPPPPDFQARHKISSLFGQFAVDFTKKASTRGVELHWIGVGTWKKTNDIVPQKHLEAWRLSRENLKRGSQAAMERLGEEAALQQTIRLIQDIPLSRYQANQKAGRDQRYTIKDLLIAYREQLVEIVEFLKKSQKDIPDEIPKAIKYIELALGIKHGPWVAGARTSPPSAPPVRLQKVRAVPTRMGFTAGIPSLPPVPQEEEQLWQDLLAETGFKPEQVEHLIEYERRRAPHDVRKDLLQRALDRWMKNKQN